MTAQEEAEASSTAHGPGGDNRQSTLARDADASQLLLPTQAVQLVLDSHVQVLSWESLPVLRAQSVYRMPSLASIHALLHQRRHLALTGASASAAAMLHQSLPSSRPQAAAAAGDGSKRAKKCEEVPGRPAGGATSRGAEFGAGSSGARAGSSAMKYAGGAAAQEACEQGQERAREEGGVPPVVDPQDAFYLLNPSGDLAPTQAAFEALFRLQPGWQVNSAASSTSACLLLSLKPESCNHSQAVCVLN
eukprot:jgi/Mesen1/3903/ME000208S02909